MVRHYGRIALAICRHLPHQCSCMLQIRFTPHVPVGAGVGVAGDRHFAAAHRMGERAGAEIGVAAVIAGDHVQAQLQGFRHAAPEALGAMQGEEHITAAIERQQFIALEAGHHQVDARIFRGAELQPMPLGIEAAGREGFDQQRHVWCAGGRWEGQLKGLQRRHGVFADGGGIEIKAIAEEQHIGGQAITLPGSPPGDGVAEALGVRHFRCHRHQLQR